ncbi:MAG: dihydrodipicolinate synthase family protein, partial [Alphaproteobacteria bacterium]|nr:dihydrodipicolinate synthase family protein [Alphaproteobacteria bacterium]
MIDVLQTNEPRGVAVATLTPITPELEPDFDRFAAHCRRMLERGADLLAVLGTTGEANSLGVDEKLRLLDALGESDIPGETLLPGTGTCSIADTVILTRKALEVGSAGVVMLPPFYYKGVSDAG